MKSLLSSCDVGSHKNRVRTMRLCRVREKRTHAFASIYNLSSRYAHIVACTERRRSRGKVLTLMGPLRDNQRKRSRIEGTLRVPESKEKTGTRRWPNENRGRRCSQIPEKTQHNVRVCPFLGKSSGEIKLVMEENEIAAEIFPPGLLCVVIVLITFAFPCKQRGVRVRTTTYIY